MFKVEKFVTFNNKVVRNAVDKARFKVLRSQGAFLRGVAKRKIRRRKSFKSHSRPGQAPFTHTGKLKKSILYAADSESVIIGPAANWIGKIGALHEFGGVKDVIKPAGFKENYNIGDIGPISVRKYKRERNYLLKVKTKVKYTDTDGSPIAFVKIKSANQAAHSSRVGRRLRIRYGDWVMARYPARPFMGPSLDEVKDKLASFWKDSVKR